jgi:hypothetical protein
MIAAPLLFVACPWPFQAESEPKPESQLQSALEEVGERLFWVNDLPGRTGDWVQIGADLAYRNERCNVWVRRLDAGMISPELLADYGEYFATVSWPAVIQYVYEPTEFFSEEGSRINILFYEAARGIAGYFWSKDFTESAKSNRTNIFYMNIDAAVYPPNQNAATSYTYGTLTHELQHLCNAHYFFYGPGRTRARNMDTWANEFASTLMESLISDQFEYYLWAFGADRQGDFAAGRSDYLRWSSGTPQLSQYVTTALLGGYIMSILPDAQRAGFIRSFLDNTGTETVNDDGLALASYSLRTSVEDLLLTLEQAGAGEDFLDGWIVLGDYQQASDDALADLAGNWSLVMSGYMQALALQAPGYIGFLDSVTDMELPDIGVPFIARDTEEFKLRLSGYGFGRTIVDDPGSGLTASAGSGSAGPGSTAVEAIMLLWNGGIPTYWELQSADPLKLGTAMFPTGAMLGPPDEEAVTAFQRTLAEGGYPYDRSMSGPMVPVDSPWLMEAGLEPGYTPRSIDSATVELFSRSVAIPGLGAVGNPDDGVKGGRLYCQYLAMTAVQ